ncbi:MAG: SDR family oxidoreductase [Kamptonema sp. SIO4C4]|nr:SDR family oxidoreductase [Kamptonema sp. SIO4C4]
MAQQLVLITGVSRGLGRAMVDGFIESGCTVLGCARSEVAIANLQQTYGNPHHFTVVDVTDARSVQAWCNVVLSHAHAPDLVINNAGLINPAKRLWEITEAEFNPVIDVNIKGVVNVIRAFLPSMIEREKGIIVNFSSGWGRSTSPYVAPYCGTKWAIEGLTQALAQELPAGLAAIPVNPGVIHTDMLDSCFGSSAASFPPPEQWKRKAIPFFLSLQAKDNGRPLTVG